MRVLRKILGVLFFVLPILAGAPASPAQTGNSSNVQGTITDPSGAVVANAEVTMHNPVSGFERSATTDASGNFSFSVPPGQYTITVNKGGYQSGSTEVVLTAGQSTAVSVGLTESSLSNLQVIGRTASTVAGNVRFG